MEEEFLTLEHAEARHLLRALVQTNGNKTQAAQLLDIDRRSLQRKLHLCAVRAKAKGWTDDFRQLQAFVYIGPERRKWTRGRNRRGRDRRSS